MVKTGFASPPASARVWVFWDWLNGYVNTQQITADLEAMHSRGIGGAMIFQVSEEAGYGMPTYGSGPVYPGGSAVPMGVEFMTGPWRALFAHAVKEAHRLGIEIGLMAGSGYCLGGPWITPEHAGRRVVWSETKITGPQRFSAVLPAAVPQVDGGKHVPFDPATVIDIAVLAVPAAVTTTPVKEWQWKAAYREDDGPLGGGAMAPKWLSWAAEPGANDPGIPLTSVINLTAKLVGGRLEWDVPAGEWTVLRIAHALGGRARQFWKPGEGGPLMDYMSAEASDVQFEATIAKLVEDIGPLAGTTFTTVEDDSPDFGDINWTWTFADEFKKRRGYDIVPYLPALMGRVVVKRSVTERFLYDFRKTMADLKADNHYGRFSELCRKHGLKFMAEAGGPPPAIVDGLQSLSRTDVPMGEFWAGDGTMSVRGTASVAHTTGGRLVAAEAFTSWTHWLEDPLLLKPYGDRAFCEGVNRCVIHNFASQRASDGKPGYVYMAGTHFEPNITWWNQSQGWIDYLTRCQFMLQQGLPVADVCVFSGVGVPNFVPPTRAYWYEMCPSLGEDYACDVASDEVVRNRFTVSNGRLALSDGMSYRLLTSTDQVSDYPSPSATMFITPELCTRLKALLNAGATVVWPRPGLMPGLSGSDSQLATQISNLWGAVPTASGERNIGKGKLIWGKTPRQVLAEAGVAPDFEQQPMATDRTKRLAYIHRRVGDTEIYFVSNRDKVNWNEANCLFRVQGKAPELWYPDNGAIIPHTVHEEVNGRTWLPLRLPPAGSVFVVFRTPADATRIKSVKRNGVVLCAADSEGKPETSALEFEANGLFASQAGTYELLRANGTKVSKTVASIPAPLAVAGPWSLRFLTGPATPGDITMNSLISWTEHSDPKVRYFSGTAAYRTTFTLPTGYLSGDSRVYLNLGVVKNLAEVTLNGRPCGLLWKHPFRVDVTDALQPGDNTLEVRITNLWPNRLIGDQNSPADQRVTRTNMTVFKKDSPLLESGLLGPVVIETAKTILTSASTSAAAPSTPLPQP